MKRPILISLILLIITIGCAQVLPAKIIADGKTVLKFGLSTAEYQNAITNLLKASKQYPQNTDVHYFLGYGYSRLNSSDGNGMVGVRLPLTIKASNEFEKIIKLDPNYQSQYVILDPYSKITSEWGALAMSYIYKNKPDSALWAYQEGKKRGGFSDFTLAINRALLNSCNPNSILLTAGDDFTFPLWYLQNKEHLRTDVSIVDPSLLNSMWYPRYLSKNDIVSFYSQQNEIDSISTLLWRDSVINIPIDGHSDNFNWTLKPNYEEKYILRGDQILVDILKYNKFKRDIYFTFAFNPNELLSLQDNLKQFGVLYKLSPNNSWHQSHTEFKTTIMPVLEAIKKVNLNSTEQILMVKMLRHELFTRLEDVQSKQEAKELLKIINDYFPEKTFPLSDDDNQFINSINEKFN